MMTKYKQMPLEFVEALNKLLTEQLFKSQYAQELNDPEKMLSTWVKYLYGLIGRLYGMETQMIGMSQKDAIKLKEVRLVDNYPPEETLAEDGLYHYLLQLSEGHDIWHKRTMHRIWNKATYRLSEVVLIG